MLPTGTKDKKEGLTHLIHNYERLLLSFHGFHLYDVYTKYKLLMLSMDRKYTWYFRHETQVFPVWSFSPV